MHEVEMVAPLIRHFEARGFRSIAEVPVAGRRADLVAWSADALVAVELKVARWRDAVRQAIAYQLWAHEAYVALPFPCAMAASRHRDRFEAEGVGLLAVLDGQVRTFLRASPSPRLFPALADLVRRHVEPRVVPLTVFGGGTTGERFYGPGRVPRREAACPPSRFCRRER